MTDSERTLRKAYLLERIADTREWLATGLRIVDRDKLEITKLEAELAALDTVTFPVTMTREQFDEAMEWKPCQGGGGPFNAFLDAVRKAHEAEL